MSPQNFDRGVILRALRFRAELQGFRLERGHYMGGSDDRADRWYLVPLADSNASRTGSGYRTTGDALKELDRLGVLRETSPPDDRRSQLRTEHG